jgi:hypothetical protein
MEPQFHPIADMRQAMGHWWLAQNLPLRRLRSGSERYDASAHSGAYKPPKEQAKSVTIAVTDRKTAFLSR